ncbi:MAG TPA: fructose-bisphosphatase class II family protein [Gaiellales bacterium]|jgi:fructose-1,6-bisphosphatase II|nr:fructose-bisphosphatase class II family protein [Gaiellales bacterium]
MATKARSSKQQPRPEPKLSEERCPCTDLASVSERSALAAGRYLGRGDPRGADTAACEAMVRAIDALPVSGTVVIGRSEQGHPLAPGATMGGGGMELELACDPVEGAAVVGRGGVGALSILAACEPGGITRVPRMYMKKMAVGPVAKGRIDLRQGVTENLQAIAEAFGRQVGDITAVVLDRPRHDDLIAEIREAGARIKVIADGDITATIDAAIRGTNDHLAVGIGGSFEGIISAAALHCLGGEIQGQLWPMSRTEIRQAGEYGIDDINQIFGIDDLVRGHQMVVGTGISNGDLLRGVRYFAEGARTQSIVLCSRCNRVRFIDSIHLFSKTRHEEIRL